MITINLTIHVWSIIFGIIIGAIACGAVMIGCYYNDRWSTAFGQGFESGQKFEQGEQKRRQGHDRL